MRAIFLIAVLLCLLSLALGVAGMSLVWKRTLRERGGRTYARVAAVLTSIAGYWLIQNFTLALSLEAVDLAAFLLSLFLVSLTLYWVCIARSLISLELFSDSPQSSILSMLFLESQPRGSEDVQAAGAVTISEPG